MTIVKTQIQSGGKTTTTSTYDSKSGTLTKTKDSSSSGGGSSSSGSSGGLVLSQYDPLSGTGKVTGVVPTEQVKTGRSGSSAPNLNQTQIDVSISPEFGGISTRTTRVIDASGLITEKEERLFGRGSTNKVIGE
jgi:hypothetical protein